MGRRRWVVIETGSNQSLVFRTNKQRLNVAASRLIWSVGFVWIPEAINAVEETGESIEHVVKASGLGVLLATPETGRRIIETVTTRAVMEAPDLEIWGVVGDVDIDDEDGTIVCDNIGAALGDAQRDAARWRPYRRSALARDQNLPYTQTCAFTGYPASTLVKQGRGADLVHHAASPGIASLWRSSADHRRKLVERLQSGVPNSKHAIDAAVVSTEDLEDEGVDNNGWVGILHSDGNGIGDIFTNLRRVYHGRDLIERLSSVSATLERCAWQALAEAIVIVDDAIRKAGARRKGWVVPILVGGDDITLVVHGGYAFEFTRRLTEHFEALVNTESIITESLADVRRYQRNELGEVTAPERISLASGLVFTKPSHPFSHGVQLAEELTKSAKTVKRWEVGAVDVHVLHESSVRGLKDIRSSLSQEHGVVRLDLWAGPIVLTPDAPDEVAVRSVAHLVNAIDFMRGPGESGQDGVPSGLLHEVRDALTAPGALERVDGLTSRVLAATADRPYRSSLKVLFDEHLSRPYDGAQFSRILTAMDLLDVSHGTAFARRATANAGS